MSSDITPQDGALFEAMGQPTSFQAPYHDHRSHYKNGRYIQATIHDDLHLEALRGSDFTASSEVVAPRTHSSPASPGAAPRFPRVMNRTRSSPPRVSHDQDELINLKRKYAIEISHLREAQQRWMVAAADLYPHLKGEHKARHAFGQLKTAWNDIIDIEKRASLHEHALTALDENLYPMSILTARDHSYMPSALASTTSSEKSSKSMSAAHKSNELPDIVDLYFEHASAVRYLSDELINLGPRPEQAFPEDVESTDGALDLMTPHEYAERHLQLLKDISFERQEAERYRQLCIQQGINLDDDDDDDDDDDYDYNVDEDINSEVDNNYDTMLSNLEYGAARIDSMMAVNAFREQYPANIALAAAQSGSNSRVAEWATSVASPPNEVSETPTMTQHEGEPSLIVTEYAEPSSMLGDHSLPHQGGLFLERTPSRRRSTSTIHQRTRQRVETFSCPPRSDSGIAL